VKIKRMTITVILFLSFFVFDIQAFDDSTGKTADELLNNTDENYDKYERWDTRFPATPKESRAEEEDQSQSGVAPIAKKPTLGGTGSPQDARKTTTTASTSQTKAAATTPSAAATTNTNTEAGIDLSGRWTIAIGDLEAEITLFQNQAAVFGTGNIRDGSNTVVVTASGDITGDRLKLDMITLGSVSFYRLALTLSGDQLSGSYSEYGTSGISTSGKASGSRLKAASVITE